MNPAVEIGCQMLKRKREEEKESDNISKLSKLNSSHKKSEDELDESVGENVVSSDAEKEQIVSTTLQDLPVEMLDMILIKTLSLEIVSQNLPRSAASEITVNVITQLRTVWSEWNSRLTTKWFKIMFHRQLKRLGSVEYKSPVLIEKIEPQDMVLAKGSPIKGMTILDKELFIKRLRHTCLEVYDSIDYSFKRMLRIVELDNSCYQTVTHSRNMMSCKLNRCLYLVNVKTMNIRDTRIESEIIRFCPDGKLVSHWSLRDYYAEMSISNEANIIVLVAYVGKLMEYSPGGELIREMTLDVNLDLSFGSHAVKLKNGQFVVSTSSNEHSFCILDSNGSVVKSFSRGRSFIPSCFVVDEEGSIMVADSRESRVFLLSSSLEYKKEILSQEQYGQVKVRILLDEINGRLLVGKFVSDKVAQARFVSDKYAQVCIFKIR